MRSTNVTTWIVDHGAANYVLLKMATDEGISGVGEAMQEGKDLSVISAIQALTGGPIGRSPFDIEANWRRWKMASPWKGVTDFTAISGPEMAKWNIAGKLMGQPVDRLLSGPVRDCIRAYPWPMPAGTPVECAASALEVVDGLDVATLLFITDRGRRGCRHSTYRAIWRPRPRRWRASARGCDHRRQRRRRSV